MNTYEVAHINEQGVDLIIVVVSPTVGSLPASAQAGLLNSLERYAHSAGLRGTAVLAWQQGNTIRSYGPRSFAPYLRSPTPHYLAANINRTLTCN